MDFSRALLLGLGVVFHAAVVCEDRGGAFVAISSFLHGFRMQGFFLIAGFFSAMAVQERTLRDFARQRLVRLGVPLVACGLTAAWWVDIVRTRDGSLTSALGVRFWATGHWLAHLWFLGTLLVCVTVLLGAHALVPDLDRRARRQRIGLVGFVTLIAVARFVAIHLCRVAPQVFGDTRWLLASPYDILAFLPFFASGYWLFLRQDLLDALVARVRWNAAAVVLYGIGVWAIPETSAARYVLQMAKVPYVLGVCGLIFWVARRHFGRPHARVRSLSEASYTIYLVHWPLLVLLYRALDASRVPAVLEFLALTIVTGVVSYWFHTRLVERSATLAFLLNGRTAESSATRSRRPRVA